MACEQYLASLVDEDKSEFECPLRRHPSPLSDGVKEFPPAELSLRLLHLVRPEAT